MRMRPKVKITGKYLLKCVVEFQIWYDTKILFCGNKQNAFVVCNSLFKRLNELFHRKRCQTLEIVLEKYITTELMLKIGRFI